MSIDDGGESAARDMSARIELKRERSLRFSIWDAGFYASLVGFGETYFVPLLVAVGGTSFHAGVFTSLPQLCISFSQFFSIMLVERLMVRKRIVVGAVSVQAVFLVATLVCAAAGLLTPWLFIALAVGYYSSNAVALPAWNSLMGDLTTTATRGRYFGRRSGLQQLVTFMAVVAGGAVLQHFTNTGLALTGFVVILSIALFSRLGSAYALIRHFELPYHRVEGAYFSFWQFLRRSPKSNFAHFVYFQALMNFAVQISAPFFVIYMLRDLGFTYFQYTISQGTFIATHFVAMRRWGAFSDRYGNRIILKVTAALMPFLPMLWLLSRDFYYIVLIQIISGFTWGGWTLAASNFMFDAVTPPKRARCAAYTNFFNGIGIFAGALIGAFLSTRMSGVVNMGVAVVHLFSPLEYLFFISGAARLALFVLMIPSIREVRDVDRPRPRDMFMMLAHVTPLSDTHHEPYTAPRNNCE